jgi:hypothetical protein
MQPLGLCREIFLPQSPVFCSLLRRSERAEKIAAEDFIVIDIYPRPGLLSLHQERALVPGSRRGMSGFPERRFSRPRALPSDELALPPMTLRHNGDPPGGTK